MSRAEVAISLLGATGLGVGVFAFFGHEGGSRILTVVAEEAAGILSAALGVVSDLSAQLPELLAQRYPWIRFLPIEGRTTFAREYVETLQACASIGNTIRLDEMLLSWKATSEIHADPALLRKLSGPLTLSSRRRVPRP